MVDEVQFVAGGAQRIGDVDVNLNEVAIVIEYFSEIEKLVRPVNRAHAMFQRAPTTLRVISFVSGGSKRDDASLGD